MNEYSVPVRPHVMPYRNTRMGGLTQAIGVCPKCGVIRPYARRFSKTGTHGEFFYNHEHALVFIVLERSNSGRNSYYIMGDVESDVRALLEKIGGAWEKHMISVKEAYRELCRELGGPSEAEADE
jgi:hypothetical protein